MGRIYYLLAGALVAGYAPLPEGAVEISETEYLSRISPAVVEEKLDDRKTRALSEIDVSAENARSKYLTPGYGQMLTYLEKVAELDRYDADTNPLKAEYPFLSAEIGITGASLTQVADAVRSARGLWREKGLAIERVRLKTKAEISRSESLERIESIVSTIEWP